MTVETEQKAGTGRSPGTVGRVGLWTAVALAVVFVEVTYVAALPAKNTLVAIGRFVGLHAALVMILQMVLVARLPWLDRRIGMDRLTSWHRYTGLAMFWLVLIHPTLIIIGYSEYFNLTLPDQFVSLAGVTQTLLGMIAAGTVVVIVALSTRFVRQRLPYELWHALHLSLYAAIVLAFVHQFYESDTFTSPVTKAIWWGLWASALGALLVGRVVTPLVRNARHGLRVSAVVPESDTVVSVHVTGRDLDRLKAKPGQFFIWRFLSGGRWFSANPFSLSAAPDGASLRLTVKSVGRTSTGLRHLKPGARVYVEGPYGAFTSLHRTRESTLLIAGGVGITPVRALLEELTGAVTVLYRVRTESDAVLLAEVRELAAARGAEVHVLTGRTSATNNPFAPANLRDLVPDVTERDVFVCGPPAMTDAVLRSLRELGVPARQVHSERFGLAG